MNRLNKKALLRNKIVLIPLRILLIGLLILGGLSLNPEQVSAFASDDLVEFRRFQIRGDITASGVGLRGTGPGVIFIDDIPSDGTVLKAYLYWATIGSANTFNTVNFRGQQVPGSLVGQSGSTCWENAQSNFVYRADVTHLMDGNGGYQIGGLPSSLQNGNDSQGATLVVIYSAADMPFRTIIINEGAVTLDFDQNTYVDTFIHINNQNPVVDGHLTYIIGDGQSTWDTGNVLFNGISLADNVFTGVDGDYWGTHAFNFPMIPLQGTIETRINNNDPNNPDSPDCVLWAGTILSFASTPSFQPRNKLSPAFGIYVDGNVSISGIGMRGAGRGIITVVDIPENAEIYQAFLYWATIGISDEFTAPLFNNIPVGGSKIGISADTCWGGFYNFTYRADVTNFIEGNGEYLVSGLPDDLDGGNDSQGASLVIIYRLPGSDRYRHININDGAVSLNFDTHQYTDQIRGYIPDLSPTEAHITYIIGDGQSEWVGSSVRFNGYPIANNVFTGIDGEYWGNLTFDVSGLSPGPSSTTTINNNNPQNPSSPDCLLWVATIFSTTSSSHREIEEYYSPFVIR